ncbi:hypothetical protein [Lysinibacillus piscis]|uniref:Uncharacterized protein n=1 Tax=Lysinibacillus piscis TaxID=2518931 RepID=A0ABQ5NL58_9BACI|nr:hypothetical protein [Lysinibacillus sp. KH24]GLC89095.1 hypothetical protein LYSBPC_22220 [Lysinibacillus sp. KH24]
MSIEIQHVTFGFDTLDKPLFENIHLTIDFSTKERNVVIVDGSTGFSKTIQGEKMINDFLSTINNIVYISLDNQEWRYGSCIIAL